MKKEDVIQRLCELLWDLNTTIDNDGPCDCFCSRSISPDSHYNSDGKALDALENIVKAHLQYPRRKWIMKEGFENSSYFWPIYSGPIMRMWFVDANDPRSRLQVWYQPDQPTRSRWSVAFTIENNERLTPFLCDCPSLEQVYATLEQIMYW